MVGPWLKLLCTTFFCKKKASGFIVLSGGQTVEKCLWPRHMMRPAKAQVLPAATLLCAPEQSLWTGTFMNW